MSSDDADYNYETDSEPCSTSSGTDSDESQLKSSSPTGKIFARHVDIVEKLSQITTSQPTADKIIGGVKNVLEAMEKNNFDLPGFLLAILWGSEPCTQDATIRRVRTKLVQSNALPVIVHNLWKPPRQSGSKNVRSEGAKGVMESFAKACMAAILENEMKELESVLRTDERLLVGNNLTGVHLGKIATQMSMQSPTIWNLLYAAAFSAEHERRKTKKRPDKVNNVSVYFCQHLFFLPVCPDHCNVPLHDHISPKPSQ